MACSEAEGTPLMMAPPVTGQPTAGVTPLGTAGTPVGTAGTSVQPPIGGSAGAVTMNTGGAGAGGMAQVPTGGMGTAGAEPMAGMPAVPMGMWTDPGPNPWTLVPEAMVETECKMDIALLKSSGISQSHAVFRYGKLCYESGNDGATDVFSVTKSVGGTVTAVAQYEVRNVMKSGAGTGQFQDSDLAADWGLSGYATGMKLAHLMSMTAHNRNVAYGSKTFSYDTIGSTGLNSMGSVVNRALAQDSSIGLANIQAVTRKLFDKLGMADSSWGGSIYGSGAALTLHDMGKLFTLLIHGGVYNNERLIGEDVVYRMTHPPFEDANTSYGEFLWLNHRGNASGIGGDISSGSNSPDGDPCSPAAFWNTYPHDPMGAPDCQATVAGATCEQTYDVGVFSAQGLGGQFIVGHPGLDLVLAVKNFSGLDGPMGLWERIRPALVAKDPMFMGNEEAFCAAYGKGEYAPDLKVQIQQPPSW